MKKIIILFLFAIMANVACAQCSVSVASNTNVLICTTPVAMLVATPSGTAPFSYVWSNNATTFNPTIASSGTYTVTATDATGCTATGSIVITQNITLPMVTIVQPNVMTCVNTTSTLTAQANGSVIYYDWSDPAASITGTITVGTFGTYTVTATDMQNGCTSTASVTVIQDIVPPNANITASATNLTCADAAATLTASGGGYYLWSGSINSNNNTVNISDAGTYTVTVISVQNGCTNSATIAITGYSQPYFTTYPTNGVLSCGNENIGVTNIIFNYNYLWSNGTANLPINNIGQTTGAHTVTVTNQGGCTATASITINSIVPNTLQVSISNIQNTTACSTSDGSATANATGGTPPYTYTWESPVFVGQTPQNMWDGVHTVTVSDANNCTALTTVTIGSNGVSNLQISFTNIVDTITCMQLGQAIAVASGGVAPYYYNWNTGNINPTLQVLPHSSGSYTVVVQDATGCTTSASINFINNTVYPTVQIVTSAPTFGCGVDSITLSVQNPNPNFTYQWSNSPTGVSIIVTSHWWQSTYTISVTSGNWCTTTANIDIQDIGPSLQNTTITSNIYPTNCITPSGSISIYVIPNNWNVNYQWGNGQQGSNVNNLASGWYSVTMTSNVCNDTIHRNFYVPAVCQTQISGYVVVDNNSNCSREASDTPIGYNGYNNYVVLRNTQTNQQYQIYTDTNGFYSAVVDTGHYVITHNLYSFGCNNLTTSCNGVSNMISLYAQNNTQPYAENNFYYEPTTVLQTNLNMYVYQQTARPAFPRQFNLHYYNNGDIAATNATITLTHDAAWGNLTMLNGSAPPISSTTTSKTWAVATVPTGGYSNTIYFTMELPQSTPLGVTMNYSASITSPQTDCNPSDNLYSWSNETTNSFDPNDKTLLTPHDPLGGTLNDGSPLVYQIRFQNTGTDTAYTVVVRDTLDLTHLDKNTFKIIGASHNMQTEWIAANIVEFRFPNIYLVDSFRNEPASHGFLQFSITPKPNTPMQSTVNNSAAIFFDYNDAVLTNTVRTVFVATLGSPLNPPKGDFAVGLELVPNPTVDKVNLMVNNMDNYTIIVTDVFGRTIMQNKNTTVIDLATQPAGTYFVTVISDKGRLTKRVVKL
jgi:SprB repeat/Secretion system C-terminal sorting domain